MDKVNNKKQMKEDAGICICENLLAYYFMLWRHIPVDSENTCTQTQRNKNPTNCHSVTLAQGGRVQGGLITYLFLNIYLSLSLYLTLLIDAMV